MSEKITLNGRECDFDPGQTILQAARANGIEIPTLCYLEQAGPHGACRLCLVEVEGWEQLPASCETPAREGMRVLTHSPRVVEARREILRMLVLSGNHNCFVADLDPDKWTEYQLSVMSSPHHEDICPAFGDCRLQDLVVEYGVSTEGLEPNPGPFSLDDDHPVISRDFSRCIQCGRCYQACQAVQVNRAIPAPYGRREDKPQGWFPVVDYDLCTHCGECVQACPVGALTEKKALGLGLAREMKKIRTTCPYCGVGCQQWLHIKDQRIVKVTGVENAQPNRGRLCVKGRFGYDFIHSPERLTKPLIREGDEFREASWGEALDYTARRFKEIIEKHGPDVVAGVSCARSTNEDSYAMQKLFRAVFKTNNIDHCART